MKNKKERANLFDFATKELSQDAFLRWFFESWKDEEIRPIVVDFINTFTKNQDPTKDRPQLQLKLSDIKSIQTFAQVDNIDVSIDLELAQGKRTIVIEDKTTSAEHNQLKAYNDAISNKWKYNSNKEPFKNPEKCVYKVFYKTNRIEDDELSRVKDAGWTPFAIDEINSFFQKYLNKTNSQILNDYIEHISSINADVNKVSEEPISDWNFVNFQTFFRDVIKHKFKRTDKKDYHFETWLYQGKLVSLAFYYHPTNDCLKKNDDEKYPYIAYPLVEFVYRKGSDSLIAYTHVTFHWLSKDAKDKTIHNWNWKWAKCEPHINETEIFMKKMVDALNKNGYKTRNMMTNKRNQTITTKTISIKEINKEELKNIVLEKLENYFKVFESVDREFK